MRTGRQNALDYARQRMGYGRGIVAQRDQALILAEAACLEVACLLTLDSDLVAVNENALTDAIEEADLHPFEIKTVQPA